MDSIEEITLRNMPRDLQHVILERAERENLSLNKAILRLLEEASGLGPEHRHRRHDLDELAGTWSASEHAAFLAELKRHRTIDEAWWR